MAGDVLVKTVTVELESGEMFRVEIPEGQRPHLDRETLANAREASDRLSTDLVLTFCLKLRDV
jgi:hypothetical protein